MVEKASAIRPVMGLVHTAGVSPSQASPETVLHVDLYGTALLLEELGNLRRVAARLRGRLGREEQRCDQQGVGSRDRTSDSNVPHLVPR